jgi:hypothetical protein
MYKVETVEKQIVRCDICKRSVEPEEGVHLDIWYQNNPEWLTVKHKDVDICPECVMRKADEIRGMSNIYVAEIQCNPGLPKTCRSCNQRCGYLHAPECRYANR